MLKKKSHEYESMTLSNTTFIFSPDPSPLTSPILELMPKMTHILHTWTDYSEHEPERIKEKTRANAYALFDTRLHHMKLTHLACALPALDPKPSVMADAPQSQVVNELSDIIENHPSFLFAYITSQVPGEYVHARQRCELFFSLCQQKLFTKFLFGVLAFIKEGSLYNNDIAQQQLRYNMPRGQVHPDQIGSYCSKIPFKLIVNKAKSTLEMQDKEILKKLIFDFIHYRHLRVLNQKHLLRFIEVLITHHGNVNLTDERGNSLLHIMSDHSTYDHYTMTNGPSFQEISYNCSMIKFLLRNGADVSLENSAGKTPARIAEDQKHLGVKKLIAEWKKEIPQSTDYEETSKLSVSKVYKPPFLEEEVFPGAVHEKKEPPQSPCRPNSTTLTQQLLFSDVVKNTQTKAHPKAHSKTHVLPNGRHKFYM